MTNTNVENFAELFEESLKQQEMRIGEVVTAEVIGIDNNFVMLSAGLKSESLVPVAEFKDNNNELEVKVGDFVTVAIEALENGYGETKLSRDKAKRLAAWLTLEEALENGQVLSGVINGQVKGGVTVMVNGIRAFLPGSLVDIRPVRDMVSYEGKAIEFKVIKLDRKRNNIVLSRRAVLEAALGQDRQALLDSLVEGMTIKGIVKNITDYGAFVDLGGIDGLLHITDLAWRRIKHPSEILTVGDEIEAKILKFDQEKNRVSLGMKQLAQDPWVGLSRRYPKDTKLFGGVTNLTDYGAFVEIEKGIEGLVHVSEMDWINKNVNPSKFVQLGDEVEVMILEIDEDRRRISLGMKQCRENPWEAFANQFAKGDKIKGVIKSVTDFGVFVGLPNGIDGLVHIHDLSWDESGEEVIKRFTKGDEIEIILLSVDAEKERVSLGIKQLEEDKLGNFISTYTKDAEIQGVVKSSDDQDIVVVLAENIEGVLPAAEVALIREKDNKFDPKIGDEIAVIITAVDRKSHLISLSVKMPEAKKTKVTKVVKKPRQDKNVSTGTTSLGVLLKAKLSGEDDQ